MATKTRGAPYPLGSDANDNQSWLSQLAQWVDDRPGVAPLTTTARNALTGTDRWDGKLVLDTTLDRLFRWDAGLTSWTQLADFAEIAALLATTGTPAALGTASRGVSSSAARADHVHPEPTWAAYTPTRSNYAVSSEFARWCAVGKLVTVQYRAIVSGAVTGNIAVGLPVAASDINNGPISLALAGDAGVANYLAACVLATTTTVQFVPAPSSAGVWSAAAPFTWGAGDSLQFTFVYERA